MHVVFSLNSIQNHPQNNKLLAVRGGETITLLAVKLKKLKNSLIATRYIFRTFSLTSACCSSSSYNTYKLYNTLFHCFGGKSGRTQHDLLMMIHTATLNTSHTYHNSHLYICAASLSIQQLNKMRQMIRIIQLIATNLLKYHHSYL